MVGLNYPSDYRGIVPEADSKVNIVRGGAALFALASILCVGLPAKRAIQNAIDQNMLDQVYDRNPQAIYNIAQLSEHDRAIVIKAGSDLEENQQHSGGEGAADVILGLTLGAVAIGGKKLADGEVAQRQAHNRRLKPR